MNVFLKYTILWVLLIIDVIGIRADIVNDEVFHFVTKEDGLPGESVSRIMPDHLGRIWLATSNGVALYNGKQLVTFRLNGQDNSANYVYDLYEDEAHTIYAATQQGFFEKKSGEASFHQKMPEITQGETVFANKGILYVGNRQGLHIYDGKTSRLITVGASSMGVENGVRDILSDKQGNIWFLSRYALNCYFPKTGKYRSYVIADKMPKGSALSQLVISQGKFFIGTKNNGLYVYSPHRMKAPYQISGIGNVITHLQVTEKEEVAVSTDGSGAFLIDAKTLEIKEAYHSKGDRKHSLPSDAVYCFVKDKHGVNWFGFYRFGLCYTFYSAPIFRRYSFGSFTTEGLLVRSFYIGNQVKLIGTNDGLYYVDEARKFVKLLTPSDLLGAHIITNLTYFKGQYYIGTYDGGLLILNPQTFQVSRIPNQPLLETTTVSSFDVSQDNKLWIGTGEGVFVWDGEGKLLRYTENNSRLCGGITNFQFDKQGNGWACSQGVSLYVAATQTFENANFPKGFFQAEKSLVASRGHQGLMFFLKPSALYYTNPSMTHFGQMAYSLYEQNKLNADAAKLDFFAANDNALLKLGEYVALSNLRNGSDNANKEGQWLVNASDMPFNKYVYCTGCTCKDQNHGAAHVALADNKVENGKETGGRGEVRPGWEIFYNHYAKVKGLTSGYIYAEKMAKKLRPECGAGDSRYGDNSGAFDQLGWGTLMLYR